MKGSGPKAPSLGQTGEPHADTRLVARCLQLGTRARDLSGAGAKAVGVVTALMPYPAAQGTLQYKGDDRSLPCRVSKTSLMLE